MATWTDLAGAFGYGTKLTSAQMQNLRDNITAAFEKASGAPVLANDYVVSAMIGTNQVGSDAIDGGNLGNIITQGDIAANAVGQSELKTSSASVNNPSDGNYAMTGGLYCYYPQTKVQAGNTTDFYIGYQQTQTSYATDIGWDQSGGGQNYAQWYYVSASGEFHWIFLLYENGILTGMSQAPDHVCFGNRGVEHPFRSIYDPSKHEIVVINPDLEDVQRIMARMIPKEGGGYLTRAESLAGIDEDYFAPKRDWFDVFNEMFEVQESKEADWIPEPVSIALPEMLHGIPVDWRFMPQRVPDPKTGKLIPVKVDPIQRVIPKPDYITPLQIREK